MSPRLLAELDASEVARREDDELARQREERAQRAHRARQIRRRWRLVGAAAVVTVLGGLLAIEARNAPTGPETEIDGTDPAEGGGEPATTAAPGPSAADTVTTTAPPATTAAPTTTQPPQTTTAPPVEVPQETHSHDEPELPGGATPYFPSAGGFDFDDWAERCQRNPYDDGCVWYHEFIEHFGGRDGRP
jgi:hypothetical protein